MKDKYFKMNKKLIEIPHTTYPVLKFASSALHYVIKRK